MPSLAESLSTLAQQSEQIAYLSSLNAQPAGPFVQSYLHLPSGPGAKPTTVLNQIRDAAESEVRLFKFIGEVDGSAGAAGGKVVEKREGVVVTPLRELKKRGKGGGNGEEIEVMLKTALRLVDDYRPMPRARAHVQSLLETHQKQLDKIAELERQIAEATSPNAPSTSVPTPSKSNLTNSSAAAPLSKLPADEAIKAEEEAIRALEASILPLRRKATPATSVSPTKELNSDTSMSTPPSSPPAAPSTLQRVHTYSAEAMQTPGRPMPNVTNSLVNGTTPHRTGPATINRFSPLRLLGTPRAPVGPSGLGTSRLGEDTEHRTIFAQRRGLGRSISGSNRPPPQPVFQPEPEHDHAESDVAGEDETIRLAPPLPLAATHPEVAAVEDTNISGQQEEEDVTSVASPVKPSSEVVDTSKVAGVDIDQDCIKNAVARIWSTLGEMMRQGVPDGKTISQDPSETIQHIYRLSQSDPQPPPSPSSASTLSTLSSLATAAPKAPPVTTDTILVAHLLMLLLRSPGAAAPMAEVKSTLTSVARARGWEGAEQTSTKVLYASVGKRTIAIDRRGAAGGTVSFSS
ncbi:hypothetical protein BCR39DRAFT_511282 [Naematelia encephala]|uniref:Uncharacterized protein n=1 Tax=Naematelia encephala TaxID=71784 RepID=A0A1Y2BLJ9_9TREE|nr:hypothetical protein BCR39DRAFT_511282 [Naematelia encephala]